MRFIRRLAIFALALGAGVAAASQGADHVAAPPRLRPTAASTASAPATGPSVADGQHELTKQDADAWLDGFVPYAIQRGDVPGAVVAIVKDGKVVTERGYGYADVAARTPVDPVKTLFRPGSVSKLYTWTAVMQLVQAGKIDLDADINTYLDFKIPPYQGRPITMRNLLTHTPGFEEASVDVIVYKLNSPTLEAALKRWMPDRVYAPGSTPAYSNYGAGLAGYIVQRVSGMPFEEYVERNIFQRLGMTHATFRQPLPASLRPYMAKSYAPGSDVPKPYELVSMPPAGSSAISGDDMAKFMIAHLDNGGSLLNPATARLMHSPANEPLPGLNRMMLGFYEMKVNGLSAIGHGGDTFSFHSQLVLFPEKNVGLYISMNSVGKDGASGPIRSAMLKEFADRYFPAPTVTPRELPTAREHAALAAGTYTSSRSSVDNWGAMLAFVGQFKVSTDKDGRLSVPALTTIGGAQRKWIEIAPYIWQSAADGELFGAKVANGKVVRVLYSPGAPISVWDAVPWYKDGAWLKPLAMVALGILLLTALAWPVGAINRWRYGAVFALTGRARGVYRSVAAFSWIEIGVVAGWAAVLNIVTTPGGGTPAVLIWFLEILGTLAFFGLVGLAGWNAFLVWTRACGWFSKLWSVLVLLAAFVMLWVALAINLISFGANW